MTIREIVVTFGFEIDQASQKKAEAAIKGLKEKSAKLLNGIAITFSESNLNEFAKGCTKAVSNVQEIGTKFEEAFNGLKDQVVSVVPEIDQDSKNQAEETIKDFKDKKVPVKPEVDRNSKKQTEEDIDGFKDKKVPVKPEVDKNSKKQTEEDIDGFKDKKVPVKPEVDKNSKKQTEEDIDGFKDKKVPVKPEVDKNSKKQTEEDIDGFKDKKVPVKLEVDKNSKKQTEEDIDGFKDKKVPVKPEVDQNSKKQTEEQIKNLKHMATKLLGGIAVVFSVAKIKGFAQDCAQAASTVQEMENKFDVVFDSLRGEVDQWAEQFADSIGRNKNAIKAYLADQQNLLVGFGMTREEGAALSKEMTSLALDIASFANQDEDIAVNAMTKAVMGESEAAKTLGAVLNDTTRAETMLAMGLSGNYSSLDQLTKMQVNYQTILRQSPDAVGDCVRSMDSYEAKARQLNSATAELKEFIGGQLLPVFSIFTGWMTQGVKTATTFAKAIFLDKEETNRLLKGFEKIHAVIKRMQPAMERFSQSMGNGINKAAGMIKAIANRMGGIENLFKVLAAVAGAFFITMNWGKAVGAAKGFVSMLSAIGKMIGTVKIKIFAVVAVIAVLMLIVEDFVNFLMGNDSLIGTIFDQMGIGADQARQTIFAAFSAIRDFLLGVWNLLKTTAWTFVNTLTRFFEEHGESIRTTLQSVWRAILKTVSTIWNTFYSVGSVVFRSFAVVIESIFRGIGSFWNTWGAELLAWFQIVWDGMGLVLEGFLEILQGIANYIASAFAGDWQGAWEAVNQIVTGIWEAMVGFLTAIWETIKLLFEMGLAAIQAIWEAGWGAVSGFLQEIWNGIVEFLSSIWANITAAISGAVNAILGVIQSVLTAISDVFQSIFTGIAGFISQIFSQILSGITGTIGSIKETIINGINVAVDFIKGLPSQAVQWGSDFIGGLKDGILSGVEGVVDAVKGVGERIRSFLHFSVPDEGPLTDYESWMPDFMGGLAEGISQNESLVMDRIKSLAGGIQTLMSAATAHAVTAATGTVNHTTSSVTQTVNIANSYSGGSMETQKNISKAMKRSASDATTQMARALAYARG